MTHIFSAQEAFKSLVKLVFEPAPTFGYRKSGQMIKRIAYGNASIVEFQRGRDSTKECVKFTLNLAIVCGEMLKIDGLMYPFGTTLQNAKSHTSHLRLRIGQVVYGHDKWWKLNEHTNIDDLSFEVRDAIYLKAIPYMENFFKNEDLLDLWKSSGYHGLMPRMRDEYIKALSGILNRNI